MKRKKTAAREAYDNWRRSNRDEYNAQIRELRKTKLASDPEHDKKKRLRVKFGLTLEQWLVLFEAQDRCCAICATRKLETKRDWSTDHCHTTGVVRGILCHHCNHKLGRLGDDIDSAIERGDQLMSYLRLQDEGAEYVDEHY